MDISEATREQSKAETAAIDSMDANPDWRSTAPRSDVPTDTSLFAGDDLVLVIRYMVDSGDFSMDDLAYAVEKPWKYVDVLAEALAALDANNEATS